MKPCGFMLLVIFLTGCEVVDSENVATGDIIADIQAHRLTTTDESTTSSSMEFIVVLREDSGGRPYLDLTGGDSLELIVDSVTVGFTKEDNAFNIRYHAEWNEPLPDPSSLTVRFTRGTGATHDSTITVEAPAEFIEPDPGFAWNPNFDDLAVSWEAVDPPVDSGFVATSCTEDEIVSDITSRSFTIAPGRLVRNDTSSNDCPGYVELVQEPEEGTPAAQFDDASSFILDQATRVTVEAQY